MFSLCASGSKEIMTPSEIQHNLDASLRKARDARITAVILVVLALLFIATSYILIGFGTVPSSSITGLEMIPYLGGMCLRFLGLGVLGGGFVFAAIYGVNAFKIHKLNHQVVTSVANS